MKKNVTLLFLAFTIGVVSLWADGKKTVYIEKFTHPKRIKEANANNLRNLVIDGMMAKDRALFRDSETEPTLQPTINVTVTDTTKVTTPPAKTKAKAKAAAVKVDSTKLLIVSDTVNNMTIDNYKKLKADYIVRGQVTTMHATEKSKDDGTVKYEGNIGYTLTLVNVNTGAIEGTETYKYPSGFIAFGASGDTEEDALLNTAKEVAADMDKYMDRYFPVGGKILEICKLNKNKAQEVYIDLGTKQGIQRGQKFDVFVVRTIAGQVAESKIGDIQAESVDGEGVTRCKVNGGKTQEAVKEAVDKGETLIVKSAEQKASVLSEGRKMFGF